MSRVREVFVGLGLLCALGLFWGLVISFAVLPPLLIWSIL